MSIVDVNRTEEASTLTLGFSSCSSPKHSKWVVARSPSSTPAFASTSEPVQTEMVCSVRRCRWRIHSSREGRCSKGRVAAATGNDEKIGRRRRLEREVRYDFQTVAAQHVTLPGNSATTYVWKSCAPASSSVTAKTSNGPAKSRISTSGKMRMATLRFSCEAAGSRRRYPHDTGGTSDSEKQAEDPGSALFFYQFTEFDERAFHFVGPRQTAAHAHAVIIAVFLPRKSAPGAVLIRCLSASRYNLSVSNPVANSTQMTLPPWGRL